jgi:branched-chain amino acid transport system permease protein
VGSFLVRNGLILALLVLVPIFVGEYWAYQLGLYFLYALAAMGVGLTWGQAGILPLGQGMFVALGAYAAAYGLFGVGSSPAAFLVMPSVSRCAASCSRPWCFAAAPTRGRHFR